jgi:hypothetical protein
MLDRLCAALLFLLFVPHGCNPQEQHKAIRAKVRAVDGKTQVLALYEPWFGHERHISVGYSSHDPDVIRKQIRAAKAMGISGFIVDWYGDREPFIDRSYALMQGIAAKEHFHIAMLYDETDQEDGATDEALADFKMFRDTYLFPNAPGREAYLSFNGRPVIFIFPKGQHTNWDRVRVDLNQWNPQPLLINENTPGQYANAFDGFYAWINPGKNGWAADGSNWGEQYLSDFYQTMQSKYPDKITVGGVWSSFDDSKASWGLNRHISARCGQTFSDTFNLWRKYYPADDPPPFLLIETWNDYEEGTAIERGIPKCSPEPQEEHSTH